MKLEGEVDVDTGEEFTMFAKGGEIESMGVAEIMQSATEKLKELKVAHVMCKKELSFHTRYFFKHQNNRKFITSLHHKLIWQVLERVLSGELTKVIINIAPRYGKTEIAVKNFISHGLALNAAAKFIHLSYSKTLALDNSEAVKDIVKSEAFQTLFPNVKVKPKSDAKEKWYTTAGGGVYATATGGQVTGFGAGEVDPEEEQDLGSQIESFLGEPKEHDGKEPLIYGKKELFAGALIIDDPLKPEDADSELKRNRINERFDSTIRNRVNSRKTPIIIIMQRLHEEDLCGHLIKDEPDDWFVLSLPAIQTDAEGNEFALWPHKHSLEELYKQKEQNATVFERQMQQNPMPKEGLMYDEFRTYATLPVTLKTKVKCYIDTADKGKDFLCGVVYTETEDGMYVQDVLYSDAAMETTEPETSRMLTRNSVEVCRVEFNNGGDGFKRSVERQTRLLGNRKTKFVGFTQTRNKDERIFSKSSEVTNMIYMPIGWEKMWPKFAKALKQHSKVGKNLHDDAPDAVTGMCEFFGKDKRVSNSDWAAAMP